MKYTKKEFLEILDPKNMCIMNPFECNRNGKMDNCKYLAAWSDLMEYIESLEKAIDKACYELSIDSMGDERMWKDWLFDEKRY